MQYCCLDLCYQQFSWIHVQVGHSEDWLCSVFSNLTEDLYVALRAAWLSGMIVHKHHMLQAGQSEISIMRAIFRKCALDAQVQKGLLELAS